MIKKSNFTRILNKRTEKTFSKNELIKNNIKIENLFEDDEIEIDNKTFEVFHLEKDYIIAVRYF